jgi:hypothetical protein
MILVKKTMVTLMNRKRKIMDTHMNMEKKTKVIPIKKNMVILIQKTMDTHMSMKKIIVRVMVMNTDTDTIKMNTVDTTMIMIMNT